MSTDGNLYQNLILAAQGQLDAEGVLPGSADELARLAGVSADEVRSLFGSSDALREGLIYQAVELLNDALRRGVLQSGSDNPHDQLRSLARSYSAWAAANPGLFRLIAQGLNEPLAGDSTLYRFTTSMRDLFERKLKQMRNLGILGEDADIAPILLIMHCVMKGANALILTRDHDPWYADDPRSGPEMTVEMFDHFLNGLIQANAPRR